ncbi:hypothetical protein GCM10009837_68670 [Streptomyces durmitorensis]
MSPGGPSDRVAPVKEEIGRFQWSVSLYVWLSAAGADAAEAEVTRTGFYPKKDRGGSVREGPRGA